VSVPVKVLLQAQQMRARLCDSAAQQGQHDAAVAMRQHARARPDERGAQVRDLCARAHRCLRKVHAALRSAAQPDCVMQHAPPLFKHLLHMMPVVHAQFLPRLHAMEINLLRPGAHAALFKYLLI